MTENNLEISDLNSTLTSGANESFSTPIGDGVGTASSATPQRPLSVSLGVGSLPLTGCKRLRESRSPNSSDCTEDMDELEELLIKLQERIELLEKKVEEKDGIITTLLVKKNELEAKNKITQNKLSELSEKYEVQNVTVNDNMRKIDVIMKDSSLVKRITELENVVKEIRSAPPPAVGPTSSGPTYADMIKKTEEKLIKMVKTDINQAKLKENRVIVFNLPITENDNAQVEKLLDATKFDKSKLIKVIRLKQKNDKIPPVILELTDLDSKKSLVKKSKELKLNELFKNVYINYDLTSSERDILKPLINERNELNNKFNTKSDAVEFYYGIRNNKVVQIRKNKE